MDLEPTGGERPQASEVNEELTGILVEVGHRMGFTAVTEYAVPGGRLDVAWLWDPPTPIPGVVGAISVAGFEIESSWRTRKHVKGDLLNLQDAGVALGVIVLAGADARDDSLRRFAASLVDRPGATILVWTHDDVRALASGEVAITEVEAAASETAPTTAGVPTGEQAHTGKYRPLWEWLLQQERREIRISFAELERQTGITLPDSCRAHLPHWYGYQGSAVARAIIDAGWHASRVDLNGATLSLVPGRSPGNR
ncbi:MAG: hypothetical protein M3O70_03420 [Actinomycetota bacterium]|nr:hypothetical protein [Actinomycetota bacterium]